METFLVLAIIFITLSTSLWLMLRNQKKQDQPKGTAAGMFASMDEIFHPNAHEAHIVIEEKKNEVTPKPSPEDKNFPR